MPHGPVLRKRGCSVQRAGEVDDAGRFSRDKLLDGRDTVPSYEVRMDAARPHLRVQ